jgi:hexosaminidase
MLSPLIVFTIFLANSAATVRDKPAFPWRGQGEQRHGGFYTQDAIREIVAYAAERNLTIVSEIEPPAHTLPTLAAYRELGCTGQQFTMPITH